MYVPKPSENAKNVKLMVEVFDKAMNDALPSVAVECSITNVDFRGCGLDPKSYVGDEGEGGGGGGGTLERTLFS